MAILGLLVFTTLLLDNTFGLPFADSDDFSDDPSPSPPLRTTTSIARGKWNSILVVPGTKWCGAGNNAKDVHDLGYANETDACCREHDHCPMWISSFKTKYNLYNKFPWTLVSCECDTKFYNCLMNVGNTASNAVGRAFYDVLKVNCVNIEVGRYCSKWHWTSLYCDQYSVGPVATLNPVYASTFNKNFNRRYNSN